MVFCHDFRTAHPPCPLVSMNFLGGNSVQQISHRIMLEDILAGSEYLSTVIEAIKQNLVLEIEYRPFYENSPSIYNLRPYCMRMHHQRDIFWARQNNKKDFDISLSYLEDGTHRHGFSNLANGWHRQSHFPLSCILNGKNNSLL